MKKVAHPYEIQNTFVIYTKVFDHIPYYYFIEDRGPSFEVRFSSNEVRTYFTPILMYIWQTKSVLLGK